MHLNTIVIPSIEKIEKNVKTYNSLFQYKISSLVPKITMVQVYILNSMDQYYVLHTDNNRGHSTKNN